MRRLVIAIIVLAGFFVALPSTSEAQTGGGSVQWDRPRAELSGSIDLVASSNGGPSWGDPAFRIYAASFDGLCFEEGGAIRGGCPDNRFFCDPSTQPTEPNVLPAPLHVSPQDGEPPPNFSGHPVAFSLAPLRNVFADDEGNETAIACWGPGGAGAARPPTLEQIWRDASVAGGGPVVELAPTGHGLTGLPTHLWLTLSASHASSFERTYGVWSVSGSVWLDRLEWHIADAATNALEPRNGSGSAPIGPGGVALGSREAPLTEVVYRTKGNYRVTGTAVWAARATITGPGGLYRRVDLPEAGLSTAYDYPVDELVGVLDNSPR